MIILRAGLKALLNAQPDMEVVGEAADGHEAIRACRDLAPDIVLMDLAMPGLGGLEAVRVIRQANPSTRIIILSMHDDDGYVRQALDAGVDGYVLKRAADSELLTAIRSVARGEIFLYPSLARVLIEDYRRTQRGEDAASRREPDVLTPREREVLTLIAQGYTNQEVADKLVISVKTVETHRAHIMEKLNLRTRAELVRYAMQKGLLG